MGHLVGPRRSRRFVTGLVAAFYMGAISCNSAMGPEDLKPDPSAPVQSSALRYSAVADQHGVSGIVPVEYTNMGSSPVYFDGCGIWLEHLNHGDWTAVFANPCPGVGVTTRIDPGGTDRRDFTFRHPADLDTYPRFPTEPVSGVYRVVMQLHAGTRVVAGVEMPSEPLPHESGRSNAFWLDFP